jgi:hypothetical protein
LLSSSPWSSRSSFGSSFGSERGSIALERGGCTSRPLFMRDSFRDAPPTMSRRGAPRVASSPAHGHVPDPTPWTDLYGSAADSRRWRDGHGLLHRACQPLTATPMRWRQPSAIGADIGPRFGGFNRRETPLAPAFVHLVPVRSTAREQGWPRPVGTLTLDWTSKPRNTRVPILLLITFAATAPHAAGLWH